MDRSRPFDGARAVVIRSTWDYHESLDDYRAWLGRLDSSRNIQPARPRALEPRQELSDRARGPGRAAARVRRGRADAAAVASALDRLSLTDAVIKPTVGASGVGVERVARGRRPRRSSVSARSRARRSCSFRSSSPKSTPARWPAYFSPERSPTACGAYRRPASFRVNSQYGGRMAADALDAPTIEAMSRYCGLLPIEPLYRAVDGVRRDSRFVLMEVEVNEPGLGLHLAPGSADRFAEALVARVRAA
jgi:hypothetical protein